MLNHSSLVCIAFAAALYVSSMFSRSGGLPTYPQLLLDRTTRPGMSQSGQMTMIEHCFISGVLSCIGSVFSKKAISSLKPPSIIDEIKDHLEKSSIHLRGYPSWVIVHYLHYFLLISNCFWVLAAQPNNVFKASSNQHEAVQF